MFDIVLVYRPTPVTYYILCSVFFATRPLYIINYVYRAILILF